jgi:hypothetical protein
MGFGTSKTRHKSRKVRALKYAARGYRVLPMHWVVKDGRCGCSKGKGCDRPGKHPMTKHGVKDSTTDRDQIKSWWRRAVMAMRPSS